MSAGNHSQSWQVEPSPELDGETALPGDKSISHRSLIFSALAEGPTRLGNLSDGLDVRATAGAFAQMGVEISDQDGMASVKGVGLHGLSAPGRPLDMGNSGTAMRLLAGLLAGQRFSSALVGDSSLSKRPMRRIQEPLRLMGAKVELEPDGTAPVRIEPSPALKPIDCQMPVASAQIQSCVLLASLYAEGRSCVSSPLACRNHSALALSLFGRAVSCAEEGGRHTVCLDNDPRQPLVSPGRIDIPGDLSSSAFFIVAALLSRQARLCLRNVNLNPTRDGVIRVLRRMGAAIEPSQPRQSGNESVADLLIGPAALKAVELGAEDVALAIDEIPILAIACASAEGTSRIRGARELRVKESDRIASTSAILSMLGVRHQCYDDGMDIEGAAQFDGGEVDADGDHRIAMAAAISAVRARRPVVVRGIDNVATSFPGFAGIAGRLGLRINQMTE